MIIKVYYRFLYLLFFCLCFQKCNNKKSDDSSIIVEKKIIIDESSIIDSYNINEIIEDIDVIPLVENKDYALGEINKLIVYNNQFIVCDMLKSSQIIVFDSLGNFNKKIAGVGKGPFEYLQINDFWQDDNKFFIYDHALKKIFVLDNKLEFLKTIYTKSDIYHNIRNISNNTYIAYTTYANANANKEFQNKNHELFLYDKKFNKITGYFPYPDEFKNVLLISYTSHFNKYLDTLRFTRPYDNYIYNFMNGKLVNAFSINYKQHELTRSKFEDIVKENLNSFRNASSQGLEEVQSLLAGYSYFYNNLIENQNLMIFLSIVNGKIVFTLYDKIKNKIVVNSNYLQENNLYNIIVPKLIFADDNYFYGILDSFYLDNYMLDDSILKNYNMSTDSNFLIVRIKFKI